MTLEELGVEIETTLRALLVNYKKTKAKDSEQYIVSEFGTVVCGINRLDYKLTSDNIDGNFKDYRVIYITTEDLVHERKNDIIWALMRSGYMRYIRSNYKNQFRNLMVMQDFGRQIIQERLRIWGDKPKYAWWVEENNAVLTQSASYILAQDPAFYDMMPEEV